MALTTESDAARAPLESLPLGVILEEMNREDQSVPLAVAAALPAIERLAAAIVARLRAGGRLFYIGSGTSGRLGVVDASEIPPTFGAPPELVTGVIAGGDAAIRRAQEFAEDDLQQGWRDLAAQGASAGDVVVGLSASGSTPYVVEALRAARAEGLVTGSVSCNAGAALSAVVEFPVEVVVGPEFVTGSTRLKAGTAQKLVLNLLSTAAMIQLGRVQGTRMVDMQLTNHKLIARGARYVAEATGLTEAEARALLLRYGSVRLAVAAVQGG